MSDEAALKQRIQFLEKEIELKNKDLEVYRKELVKANAQLEGLVIHIHSQLKKALEIQRQIVPTEFPHIPGFEFSTKFSASSLSGGDYFDIFEHKDKMQFGFLLSSASSYNVSALFLSLFMKFTFEARQNLQTQEPSSLLRVLQEELVAQLSQSDTFQFFYGVMNRRHLRMNYIIAGGVIGIHHKQTTNALTRLPSDIPSVHNGVSLTQIAARSLDFEPKDKLILCSPGILKVSNEKGELFGEDLLYSIIKKSAQSDVHNLRNEIFFQLQQFAQGKPYPQDLTVIVVETKERVLKLAST